MKTTKFTTAISFAALVAAVPAMALNTHGQAAQRKNNRGQQQQMRFRGMDRDGNGVITLDEWRGNKNSFRKHDRNGDGVLSGDELRGNAKR